MAISRAMFPNAIPVLKELIASGTAIDKRRAMNLVAAMLNKSAFLWEGRPKVTSSFTS